MNRLIVTAFLCLLSSFSLMAQEWLTNFEEAKNLASKSDKNIILVFQGSDWCAPCMKLEREIWDTKTFKDFSKNHFVLLKADFPKKKKNRLEEKQQQANNALAERYNSQGIFPLVLVLNKNGKVLGSTGYKKMTPSDYVNLLISFEK